MMMMHRGTAQQMALDGSECSDSQSGSLTPGIEPPVLNGQVVLISNKI